MWKRAAWLCLAIGITTAPLLAQDTQPATQPTATDQWLGINHGDVAQTILISDLQALGIHMIREGFNAKPNAEFGAKVDAYIAADIHPHVSLNMRGNGIDDKDYPTWLKNYKQRCIDIMTAYKGKLDYYIVGNEPDKQDAHTGRLTAEQAVDFTRMAFEASREVDPSGEIKVESPPLSSPRPIRNYYRKMLAAGLADCCDVIGIHAYSNQVNDNRLDDPWKGEQEKGGTQKPVAISELGVTTEWAPKQFTLEQKQKWKADFIAQAYVQAKRYGFANVIFFNSSDASKWPGTFDILRTGTPDRTILPATYDELKDHFKPSALQDGDFESPNDFKHEWVVYHDPTSADWDTSSFNFLSPGGHSGSSALQIDTSGAGPRIVRQVVSDITPGTPLTITAWAFANKAGATLKAEGYNATAGNVDTAATTKSSGTWEQLAVTVTPTNPWVVVELSAIGDNTPGDFVKFDDVAVTPGK